jgi:hypothetical protein
MVDALDKDQIPMIEKKKDEKIEGTNIIKGTNKIANEKLVLDKQLNSGANWFFWIAGLSLLNYVFLYSGSSRVLAVGLGITWIIDLIIGSWVALLLDSVVTVAVILLGILAKKGNSSVFIAGMILYGLDSILCLLVGRIVGFVIHLVILYYMYGGLNASMKLSKYRKSAS